MKQDANHLIHTYHSLQRAAERGIRRRAIDLIWSMFDRSSNVGGGCESLHISWDEAAALIKDGVPRELVERAARVALVVCGEAVVTCLRPRSGKAGRRYRRDWQRNHRRQR